MLNISIAEGHPEPDASDFGEMGFQALYFLMIHQVHILRANFFEIELLLHRHWRGFDPVAIFPVAGDRGHFADVDFGIKVCGKRLPMVAAVAIENIQCVDAVEMMLFQIGRKYARHAGIEPGAEQRGQARSLKPFMISPLPVIFELRHIEWFVIGGIHIIDTGGQARVHDIQVLIRQR